ncbi:hypothetical protein [Nitrosomonas sp. PLL12-2]|nr:hypothetical protein [Nitrosomonas sp. PLL12-2]
MRIIFAGTPVFAAKALLSLLNAEYQIVLVLLINLSLLNLFIRGN